MDIKLIDGTPFVNTEKKSVNLFSYSRKYTNTKWLTTILPVSFDYSDWSSKFEIAEVTGINAEVEDGILKSFTYEKTLLKSGSKTKPNHPYLIRAKKANTSSYQVLSKTNCEVYPTTSIDNIELVSEDFKFVISGTYSRVEYPDFDYYFSGETWKPATATITVGPFRSFVCIDIVDDQITPEPGDLIPVLTTVDYQNLVNDNSIVVGKLTINDQEIEIKAPIAPTISVSYKDLSGSGSIVVGKLTIGNQTINIKAPVPVVTDNSQLSKRIELQEKTIELQEERIKSLEQRLGSVSFQILK